MEPYEHVQDLIDKGVIAPWQWSLYVLADQYLKDKEASSDYVTMRFGTQAFVVKGVYLDTSAPALLFLIGGDATTTYAAWSDLRSVTAGD